MNGEHDLCKLQQELAVLRQKSEDEAKALVLARDVASAKWSAYIAVVIALVDLAIVMFRK